MIKKYNEFISENIEMADPQTAPSPSPSPSPRPETIPSEPNEKPNPRPSRPGITPTHTPSEEDAPMAYRGAPEEEEDEYKGRMLMIELADKLGTELEEDGSIEYEGNRINFYSETEKFHIGKNKFETVDEVLDFLQSESPMKYESKSYRVSRFRK